MCTLVYVRNVCYKNMRFTEFSFTIGSDILRLYARTSVSAYISPLSLIISGFLYSRASLRVVRVLYQHYVIPIWCIPGLATRYIYTLSSLSFPENAYPKAARSEKRVNGEITATLARP